MKVPVDEPRTFQRELDELRSSLVVVNRELCSALTAVMEITTFVRLYTSDLGELSERCPKESKRALEMIARSAEGAKDSLDGALIEVAVSQGTIERAASVQ